MKEVLSNTKQDGWDLVREEKDDGVDVEITNYLVPQGEVLAFQRDGDWFYLHGDGLSSTQLVTDENGAQVGRAVYGAWGETLSFNESVPGSLDVRFVGGLGVRNDAATGLIYMRNRWYDSELGRFISRDPIGHSKKFQFNGIPQKAPSLEIQRLRTEPNLYVYGINNPSSLSDSYGLSPCGLLYQACLKASDASYEIASITYREEIINMAISILRGDHCAFSVARNKFEDEDEWQIPINEYYRSFEQGVICNLIYSICVAKGGG